ncbi:Kanadaptin [Linnemannia zychae]|nr:Kanadaptin [Linnemannia zychae]
MTFAVPQLPAKATATSTPALRGSNEIQESKEHSPEDTSLTLDEQEKEKKGKGVFAMPAVPVKRGPSSSMPPPPLFPKEQKSKDSGYSAPQHPTKPSGPPPNAPPLKYQRPAWSGYPNQQFFFEVIKNGVLVDKVLAPNKEFLTIGRLPMCDLEMEHPSLSRYHAVIQFKSNGDAFLYDLNSSHGTVVNKAKIPPQIYVKIKPGDQLRFGESTRIYLFQTEDAIDQEEEERQMVKAMIEKQNRERPSKEDEEEEEEFNSWGMAPDAVEEDDDDEYSSGPHIDDPSKPRRAVDPDAFYRKDPKKALRHYLESRGYSCEFELEESGPGHAREYTARIRLPIETSMGPLYGQATTGKKRDAEREAALDACIQLDSRGMLNNRSSSNEGSSSHSRAQKVENSDDDDDFYDRTVKKKKTNTKASTQKADSHETLLEKQSTLKTQIRELEAQIENYDAAAAARKKLEDSGDLDAYMASLESEKATGKDSKPKLMQMLAGLRKEEKRLEMLIEYTKPVDIMAKIAPGHGSSSSGTNTTNPQPLTVKRQNETEKSSPESATEAKKPRILGPSLPPPS